MSYTIDIDIGEPIENALDEIMNGLEEAVENIRRCSRPEIIHDYNVDVHELLAEHKAVALVFAIADVKKLRPDLTDAQAEAAISRAAADTGLPTTDPVRFGAAPLVDAIVREAMAAR